MNKMSSMSMSMRMDRTCGLSYIRAMKGMTVSIETQLPEAWARRVGEREHSDEDDYRGRISFVVQHTSGTTAEMYDL